MASGENHVNLDGGVTYVFNPVHRNRTPGKSQWMIGTDDEVAAFQLAGQEDWLVMPEGWSLHLVAAKATYLGKSADGRRDLFIARFRGQPEPLLWHGYPADPHLRSSDVPLERVLATWSTRGWIRKRTMRLLLEGSPCSL